MSGDTPVQVAARDGHEHIIRILAGQAATGMVVLDEIDDVITDMVDRHGPVLGCVMLLAAATEVTHNGLRILLGPDEDLPAVVDTLAALPSLDDDARRGLHHAAVLYAADTRRDHDAWTDYLFHVVDEEQASNPQEVILWLTIALTFTYTYHLNGHLAHDPEPEPRPRMATRLAALLLRTGRHHLATVRDRPRRRRPPARA